ncbi:MULTISPECIES: ImmA/IrrE family metallo-endopeptidase [Pseudonocardia]|uniref:IrrE N-terminal-like domain-containing protein n=2 Tax=Pseudonocardia TaxID=1847 RepID=A0A1Y2MNW2_PSEAH|nr:MULTISPECIES: ImmA/IrrE family metallo-endopeptidase [Pseudonocardia]OSY36930.1 hypothetical protein BG845_05013 [Pseudonocardia autotrophica]TDN75613.1 uncharacterized protein DUF955 [Pseudonocardia autotrophica]BBF99584.1 hypothetical protein Pdca_07940 [Pseudonocardia autotrophica]GEC28603.1 hypothetical protein PSA01_56320 [Pseudonocardia saturnea]
MTPESEGRAAAEEFRVAHHLGVQPLGDLVAIIEQVTGIDVSVVDVGPDEHGLTMRDPVRDAVFIAVARTDRPMRQRSTLAHELAHVVFEDRGVSDDELGTRPPAEIRADAFARHLLVPVEGLPVRFGGHRAAAPSLLSDVVQRYLVSPAVATIALHQAGLIDLDTKAEWMTMTTPVLAARHGWSDQYRALADESDRRRAPQRLLTRAIDGYLAGVVSVAAIARLRGLPADVVEREFVAAGLTPHDQGEIGWVSARSVPVAGITPAELDADFPEGAPG